MERGPGHKSADKILVKLVDGAARSEGKLRDFAARFRIDRSGNYTMITALMAPMLLGLVGLGTENGVWLYTHQTAQSAADAAAFSAAQSYSANGAGIGAGGDNPNLTREANAIAASYGFV